MRVALVVGVLRAQDDLRSQLDRFAIIFYYIRNQYVDEVDNSELVHAAIDGRERVRGHGASRMPIWGLGFQELDRDTNQEDEVRDKIVALIAYLETIQDGE